MFYGMLERLIRCFIRGKSDRMHFRALCVAAISVSGSQLKVQTESFPWSSLQEDRTSPSRDTLPNLLSCSKNVLVYAPTRDCSVRIANQGKQSPTEFSPKSAFSTW